MKINAVYFYFNTFSEPGQANPPRLLLATTSSITLQWNYIPIAYYEYYSVIQDGVEVMTNIYTNTATIDSLLSNTCYGFQIQAHNSAGKGPPSCENRFATSKQIRRTSSMLF